MSTATIAWREMADSIALKDADAAAELYEVLQTSYRAIIRRNLPDDATSDRLHEVYIAAVEFIQAGNLREAERLAGFLKTVTVRTVIQEIRRKQRDRNSVPVDAVAYRLQTTDTPETEAYRKEQKELMRSLLQELSKKDREVLTRFYLLEQPVSQILDEMGLTETQFRLLKSRAKSRFQELGRERLSPVA